MGCSLLVGGEYMVYPVAAEVELVEQVDDLTARKSENGLAALLNESFNDYLSSCYSHNISFL